MILLFHFSAQLTNGYVSSLLLTISYYFNASLALIFIIGINNIISITATITKLIGHHFQSFPEVIAGIIAPVKLLPIFYIASKNPAQKPVDSLLAKSIAIVDVKIPLTPQKAKLANEINIAYE